MLPGLPTGVQPVRWGYPKVGEYYMEGSYIEQRGSEAIRLCGEHLIVAAAPGWEIVDINGCLIAKQQYPEPIEITIRTTVRNDTERDLMQTANRQLRGAGLQTHLGIRCLCTDPSCPVREKENGR